MGSALPGLWRPAKRLGRQVVLSAELMGIPFTHRSISVLQHVERFKAINPMLKEQRFGLRQRKDA